MKDAEKRVSTRGMWWQGAVLALLLYLIALPLRPLFSPWEYDFAGGLRLLFPFFPPESFYLRLPAAVATLFSAWLVWAAGRVVSLKRPGGAAALYLLLPPVFWLGTAASAAPFFALGSSAVITGVQCIFISQRLIFRIGGAVLVIAGAVLPLRVYYSPFFAAAACWTAAGMPLLALALALFFEFLEKRGDGARRLIDRIARVLSYTLVMLALLVLLPAVLRHFKVDFPEKLALYAAGERIFRPELTLLVPLLWLHLARGTNKINGKLAYLAAGISFLLLTLPLTLPWSIMRDLAPELVFAKLSTELRSGNPVCFADSKLAPVLAEELQMPVLTVGNAPGDIPPEKLAAAIGEKLLKSDVVLACSDNDLSAYRPQRAVVRYTIGRYRLFRYPGGGVK